MNASNLDSTYNSETGQLTDHDDEPLSSLDHGTRSRSPSVPLPVSESSGSPRTPRSFTAVERKTSHPSPLIARKGLNSSTPSLASLLSGLSNSSAKNQASRESSLSDLPKDKKNGGMGNRKHSMSDTTLSDQQDVMMAVASQLMTAGLGLGFQLKDIAPILTPMEVTLYNPRNPTQILGLEEKPLSARVVSLTACQGFVFVQVEAAVRVTSGQSRKRGPVRRSLRSLRRRLNVLCRTTIRRTASRRGPMAACPNDSVLQTERDKAATDDSQVCIIQNFVSL